MNQFQCDFPNCGRKDALIFRCSYCQSRFCAEHHLPENHNCTRLPGRPPPPDGWSETKSPVPDPIPEPPEPHPVGMKNRHKAVLAVGLILVIFSCSLLIWGAITPTPTSPSPIPNYVITPSPNISSITPAPLFTPDLPTPYAPNTSPPLAPYVEVNYQTVGWFYGTSNLDHYNYTYLVLNVTITNQGYSQVNVFKSNGFTVTVNDKSYQPYIFLLDDVSASDLHNASSWLRYSFTPSLPYTATLLDTGTVTGIIIFQFGEPTIYPHPAQILNEPFILKYLVTYGEIDETAALRNAWLGIIEGPTAKVVTNEIS